MGQWVSAVESVCEHGQPGRQRVTMVRGEGSWVFDDHGRAYLDAIASPIVRGPGEIPPA